MDATNMPETEAAYVGVGYVAKVEEEEGNPVPMTQPYKQGHYNDDDVMEKLGTVAGEIKECVEHKYNKLKKKIEKECSNMDGAGLSYSSPAIFGGGAGGWGGIAPVGVVGLNNLFDGRRGDCDRDHDGGHAMLGSIMESHLINNLNDNVNSKFAITNSNIDRVDLHDNVRSVKDHLGNTIDSFRTDFGSFKIGALKAVCDVEGSIKNVGFETALLAKENITHQLLGNERITNAIKDSTQQIVSSQKDCCCEQKMLTMEEGRLTRDLINALELKHAEDKINNLKSELSNERQTRHVDDKFCELEKLIMKMEWKQQNSDQTIIAVGNTLNQITTAVNSLVAAGQGAR